MKPYQVESLVREIRSRPSSVILFGAGRWGILAFHALRKMGVTPSYFCDSDPKKHGSSFCGIEVIAPERLPEIGFELHVFISCNYIMPILGEMRRHQVENVYNCVPLFAEAGFSDSDTELGLSGISVMIERHRAACLVVDAATDPVLAVRGMDLMVTEACTMRCKDCSNLMQYYTKPKHEEPQVLLRAFETLSKCVDRFLEVRLIGGEPLMNKRIHEIVNELASYPHVEKIAVFTNATIVPRGEVLQSLRHRKVYLDITNYGVLSKNHGPLLRILDSNGILYTTHAPFVWTDSAKIQFRKKSEKELAEMFSRCCVNDVLTLLHGKLYRCPFSANAMNLTAIPTVDEDVIDLTAESPDLSHLRRRVRELYTARTYISACAYCNGRDYTVATVEPGVQAKSPLAYQSYAART